jgi:probable rRNA maturation factor
MSRTERIAVQLRGRPPAPMSAPEVRDFTRRVAERVHKCGPAEVGLMFCGDTKMRELNERYLHRKGTTDVISFPMGDEIEGRHVLGDIVISAARAKLDAARDGMTVADKVRQLCVHGLLHLAGYDHETPADARRMDARARKLLTM